MRKLLILLVFIMGIGFAEEDKKVSADNTLKVGQIWASGDTDDPFDTGTKVKIKDIQNGYVLYAFYPDQLHIRHSESIKWFKRLYPKAVPKVKK